MPKGRAAAKKVSCDECYFRCNLLCALNLDEPCATFRPDHPDGLRPPRQLRFTFRQERRTPGRVGLPQRGRAGRAAPLGPRLLHDARAAPVPGVPPPRLVQAQAPVGQFLDA